MTLMTREWSMPNAETFSIPPIRDFVKRHIRGVVVDPFARNTQYATYSNDLNPITTAKYHMECESFLEEMIRIGVVADVVLLDPPYSPRQVKECYDGIGLKMSQQDAWGGAVWKRRRRLIEQIVRPGSTVLTFGWNTNGMGKGWRLDEILLVAHGSDHNDTICMAETLTEQQRSLFHGGTP